MKTWKYAFAGVVAGSSLLAASQATLAEDFVNDAIVIDPGLEFIYFDEKTMPGNGCQALDGAFAGLLDHWPRSLYNSANGYVGVTCPLVRDNTTNVNGTVSAELTGFNTNAGTAFSCWLYSFSDMGGIQQVVGDSTAAAGNFTFNLDVNASIDNGYYTIYCRVPTQSGIYSYRWADPLRTDANN